MNINTPSDYVSNEEVEAAKRWSVMDYVEQNELDCYKKVGQSYKHRTVEGGLYLYYKNAEWHYKWFAHDGKSGTRALYYLLDVHNMRYQDAVRLLNGGSQLAQNFIQKKSKIVVNDTSKEQFKLPQKAGGCKHMYAYLTSRGISRNVINGCMKLGILYESEHQTVNGKKVFNCCFVGKDDNGKAVFASTKGTVQPLNGSKRFSGIATNSNKDYTFRMINSTAPAGKKIHLFEAAIDALSWMTIQEIKGVNLNNISIISAEGITGEPPEKFGYDPKNIPENYKIDKEKCTPLLPQFLKKIVNNSNFSPDKNYSFVVHYDNDFAGETATIKVQKALENLGYKVEIRHAPNTDRDVKDWNDYLCKKKHLGKWSDNKSYSNTHSKQSFHTQNHTALVK